MSQPILTTKLNIPALQPADRRIPRPHLITCLQESLHCKLTLVSAPAGFGKTTLLAEWVQASPEQAVAWLSLDEGDSDPMRFWTYFVATLRQIEEKLGESALALLRAPQAPPPEAVVVLLINEISQLARNFVVILDDYHLISSQSVHESLVFLLDHMPSQMHLIIAGRSDPPLPLARLRGRRQLTELRAEHLRFTAQESAGFLNQIMQLNLTAAELAALETRTEGWITGLQLAALSLQGQSDSSTFIDTFAGDDRYILDYLLEEVLNRQSPAVRDFLLQTSILKRLCGPLCDVLTGNNDGQAMLEQLEQSNLFIVALDNRRQWFRYHHLFAHLLFYQLERVTAVSHDTALDVPALSSPKQLNRRASLWYQEHDLMPEAIEHSLAAQDYELAAELLESFAWPAIQQGEYSTLKNWLEALDTQVLYAHPQLCLMYTWALSYVGEIDMIEYPLTVAEQSWLAEGSQAKLGRVITFRAKMAAVRDELDNIIELSQKALALLAPDDLYHRGLNWLYLGTAFHITGDMANARPAYEKSREMNQASGNLLGAMAASNSLGLVMIALGQLQQAAAIYRGVIKLAGEVIHHGRLIAHVLLSTVLYEWNQLEAAEEQLRYGLDLLEQTGMVAYTGIAFGYLASVLWAQGKTEQVRPVLERGIETERILGGQLAGRQLRAIQVRLDLYSGDVAAGRRWREACEINAHDPINNAQHELEYLTLARVLLAGDQVEVEQALSLLGRLHELAVSQQRVDSQIRILVLMALAHQKLDELTPAILATQRALQLAEPAGYQRVFLDEGALMQALLLKSLQGSEDGRHYSLDYVSKLLTSLRDAVEEVEPARQALVEPLTPREMEVLKLIAAGLTNREIAQELVVTQNTVKVHIKNLYSKLNVSNRTQAAGRARELNLF